MIHELTEFHRACDLFSAREAQEGRNPDIAEVIRRQGMEMAKAAAEKARKEMMQ